MKVFTQEQLSESDGTNGKPAYVAYKGIVYDVSESFLWKGGKHQGLHRAGRDLTSEIENAPHEADFLERFPIVGELRR